MAQSILSNTIIATIGRGLNVALGLVVVKLLTNYLGPSGYGAFGLLLSLGTILQLVADGGLYLQLTRSIAEEPKRQDEIIGAIFSLRLALLAAAFAVGLSLLIFVPEFRSLAWPFMGIAIGLTFQSMSQLAMGIFQHRQVVWRATIGDLVGRLGQIGAVIFFGLSGAALSGMTAAFAVGSGVAWLLHHLTLPLRRLHLRLNWAQWKQLLKSSWPLGAMLVLNAVYFRIDMIILSVYRSPAEVGWYNLAYRIIESGLFFPAMFGGLLLPRLSEARGTGRWPQLRHYLSQGLTLQAVVAGFVVVTLLLQARGVILLVADAAFIASEPILMILSLALGCMFFGNVFGFAMIALEKQTTLLKMYAVLAVANTVANILTIPYWGTMAAAVTTVLTELAATVISGYIVWRIVSYRIPMRSLLGTALAAALAAAVYLVVPPEWPVLLAITLASLGYSAGIVITRTLNREQLSLLVTTKIP